jgi:hypothetical protein
VVCFDDQNRCPSYVTPRFLEEGANQGVCAYERDKFYCRVSCPASGGVFWNAEPCPRDLVTPCPPWERTVVPNV